MCLGEWFSLFEISLILLENHDQVNYTRKLVIPDIHGCSKTFEALLEKIHLSHSDLLILLGDYVDRGKDGKGVLDMLLKLQDEAYQLRFLKGNHEEMLLAAHYKDYDEESLRLPRLGKSKGITDENRNIYPQYLDLLKSMSIIIEIDEYIITHGGVNFDSPSPLEDLHSMIWGGKGEYRADKVNNKKVIHGHTPTELDVIKLAIENDASIISLDNGCVYAKRQGMGNLLCLNLDNRELVVQKNID